jgi:hypothetical protein
MSSSILSTFCHRRVHGRRWTKVGAGLAKECHLERIVAGLACRLAFRPEDPQGRTLHLFLYTQHYCSMSKLGGKNTGKRYGSCVDSWRLATMHGFLIRS